MEDHQSRLSGDFDVDYAKSQSVEMPSVSQKVEMSSVSGSGDFIDTAR